MEKQTVGVPAGQTEARACGCEWTAVGHCLRWVGGEWRPSGEFRPCFRREHKQKAGGARAEAASFSVEGRAAPFPVFGTGPVYTRQSSQRRGGCRVLSIFLLGLTTPAGPSSPQSLDRPPPQPRLSLRLPALGQNPEWVTLSPVPLLRLFQIWCQAHSPCAFLHWMIVH